MGEAKVTRTRAAWGDTIQAKCDDYSRIKLEPGEGLRRLMQLTPFDEFNRSLVDQVHPSEWQNPKPSAVYHLVVIGAGTAGLVTAAGAAGLGARVALVERKLMGGDCLNFGCVPSKALIRAARVAATLRSAHDFGVHAAAPVQIHFAQTMERMRRLRAQISSNDSARRFQELGVDVYFGRGAFVDGNTIEVVSEDGGTSLLSFKKAVIATGGRAATPAIPGLDQVPYLTNETLFSLTELPSRLGVIGGGPIGCEMAQALARLGSEVILFEQGPRILPREDAGAAAILQAEFQRDGIQVMLESRGLQLEKSEGNRISIRMNQKGIRRTETVDQVLLAVGRSPNTEAIQLENAGVEYDQRGIHVNDFLQTSNRRIYAAGDVCSRFQFTHAADFQARIVIQNALFAIGPLGRKRASNLVIPRATYTSPEIAHVGWSQQDASAAKRELNVYIQPLSHVDRAVLDGQEQGFIKVFTPKGSDQILGATIVAENAGDLISELTLAINHRIGLSRLGSTIHPYPTQAEAIRKLGDQYNRTKLTPASKKMLGLLRRLNVGS